MPNTYATLASEIFANEFESQTGFASHSQISGWLATNLGQLNTLLHKDFSGDDLDREASGIFKDMYMSSYYKKAHRNALRGVLVDGGVLSISDVDYKIAFTNRNEVAKVYKSAYQDLDKSINEAAYRYSMYEYNPKQIDGYETTLSGFC